MRPRSAPLNKARELVSRYGTARLALQFAQDTRGQHEPAHPSFRYWDEVAAQLSRIARKT